MSEKTPLKITDDIYKEFKQLFIDGKFDDINGRLTKWVNEHSNDVEWITELNDRLEADKTKDGDIFKTDKALNDIVSEIIKKNKKFILNRANNKNYKVGTYTFKINLKLQKTYKPPEPEGSKEGKEGKGSKKGKEGKGSKEGKEGKKEKTKEETEKPKVVPPKEPVKKSSEVRKENEAFLNQNINRLKEKINTAKTTNDYQIISDSINTLREFRRNNQLDKSFDNQLSDLSKIAMEQEKEQQKQQTQTEGEGETQQPQQPKTGSKTYEEYKEKLAKAKNKTQKNKILYDMYETVKKTQTNFDDEQYINLVKETHESVNSIKNYNKFMNEKRGNLSKGHPNSLEQRPKKPLQEYYDSLKYLFKEKEPETVSTLPKKIIVKPVPEEELLSPAEKLAKAKKELNELKSTLGTSAPTEEQQSQINKLEGLIKELTPEVEKKKKEEQERTTKTSEATVRQGDYRPHFKNVTKGAVEEQLSKSAEEQIRDVKNWFIFDIPDSFTGQGTALDNPIIRQNDARDELLYSGNLYQDFIQAYNGIVEGVDGRKDFYKENNVLTSQGVKDGLTEIYYEETEEQFLQRFNKGTNALFSQDQTPFEKNDFQNIYQTPARFFKGGYTQPQFINNNGIVHNNDLWINNPNYFYKGAVVN